MTIIGNYFEANGNSVGVFSPYGHTTIDTNHFWAFYGHGWKMNRHQGQVVSGKAHVIVDSTSVQLRNNRYHGDAVLVFGLSGRNSVDALPVVAEEVDLTHGAAVPDSSGIGVYVYDAESGRFALRPFSIPPSTE